MIDKNLLMGKIVSTGNTQTSVASQMGISKNTLNEKINGKKRFYAEEVLRVCEIVGVDSAEEMAKIFYPGIPKTGQAKGIR